MNGGGDDPPPPGEKPVSIEVVRDPKQPVERSWNPDKATHDARVDLAQKIYWLVVVVVVSICLLAAASLSPLVISVPESTSTSVLDAATFLATSLLPAIIGILGSVIGFYFGRETRDPPDHRDDPPPAP
jgi:hypothetical protein